MKYKILEYLEKHIDSDNINKDVIETTLGLQHITVVSEDEFSVNITMQKPFVNIIRFFLIGYIALGYTKPILVNHMDYAYVFDTNTSTLRYNYNNGYSIIDIFEEHDLAQFKSKNIEEFPISNYELICKVLYVVTCFKKQDIDTFNNILRRIPTKYRKRIVKTLLNSDESSNQFYKLTKLEYIVEMLKWIDECGVNEEEDELYL